MPLRGDSLRRLIRNKANLSYRRNITSQWSKRLTKKAPKKYLDMRKKEVLVLCPHIFVLSRVFVFFRWKVIMTWLPPNQPSKKEKQKHWKLLDLFAVLTISLMCKGIFQISIPYIEKYCQTCCQSSSCSRKKFLMWKKANIGDPWVPCEKKLKKETYFMVDKFWNGKEDHKDRSSILQEILHPSRSTAAHTDEFQFVHRIYTRGWHFVSFSHSRKAVTPCRNKLIFNL